MKRIDNDNSFNSIKTLLDKLIGNKNVLSNNILFIDFTGSHEKAQLLSQMWYWSDRTKFKDGWFCKSYEEWHNEIRLKEHSVRRYVKEFVGSGFLYTDFRKFNGYPKLHYRLDKDKLIDSLVTFCKGDNLQGLQNVSYEGDNLQPSMKGDNLQPFRYRDLTQKTNTEINGKRTQFQKPAVEEIITYLEELFLTEKWRPLFTENPPDMAASFFDHYESNGWLVGGKSKMKNWESACRNWLRGNKKYNRNGNGTAKQPARLVSEDTHRQALAITLQELGYTGSGNV